MPPSERERLDPDTAFSLLSNARRRHVLCLLAERDEELPLRTVTTELVRRLDDGEGEEPDEGTYQSVYVSLYQNHLPRLAKAGVIRYDREGRTARIEHNRKTKELLQLTGAEVGCAWRRAYLLVLGATLLTAVLSFGGPLQGLSAAWLPPTVVLIGGTALIGGCRFYARDRVTVEDCGRLAE